MSILKSLYTGISGLIVNGLGLDVVTDNIANVNTVGFKRARGNFQDILSQTQVGANVMSQVGSGAQVQGVEQTFEQGTFQNTNSGLDLAVSGAGFFIIEGTSGGQTGQFYTRAGQFLLDDSGYLVSQAGLRVQGWMADQNENLSGVLSDLKLTGSTFPPKKTENATVSANLDADAAILGVATPWDAQNPANTSNFSISVTVYDSLGRDHVVEVYFRKESDYDPLALPPTNAQWNWYALVDGGEITGGAAGIYEVEANGTLEFNENGALAAMTTAVGSQFDFAGAAQAQVIAFDFGDDIASGGTGLAGCTMYGSPSGLLFLDQDGHSVGNLLGLQVMSDGRVFGTHTNGETRLLAQMALATFPSTKGLQKWGGNLWIETPGSGSPVVGEPNTGGRGVLHSNALEQSNVDLAEEFVNMISFQRGFQASSRSITTADQLLQEVVNLKR